MPPPPKKKKYILPELHAILLKVAPYFKSCMIYLTNLNDHLNVVLYFVKLN